MPKKTNLGIGHDDEYIFKLDIDACLQNYDSTGASIHLWLEIKP